jgi:hypothetical protein
MVNLDESKETLLEFLQEHFSLHRAKYRMLSFSYFLFESGRHTAAPRTRVAGTTEHVFCTQKT